MGIFSGIKCVSGIVVHAVHIYVMYTSNLCLRVTVLAWPKEQVQAPGKQRER